MTLKYVLLSKYADMSGYTIKAIERKIEAGIWIEGRHFRKAPDGKIHINTEAATAWVEGQLEPLRRSRAA